ncbi:GIY-YIG nuclease family protein [Aestuariivivens sediminicola]|uniref:GIY-YIG nuclease family protein n=1 Tax=Aestuariivivens sediminicola TaxID=2913560 RepID=UPI001F5A3645|nr:GIY-YIG nuclease family protein [Aestuariivivens sediminicola]
MYFVYALWSETHDKIYVGFTSDLDKRLETHNKGKSKYTSRFRPWIRFFEESVNTKAEARKKEIYYKSGWGRRKLKLKLEEWQSGRMRQS